MAVSPDTVPNNVVASASRWARAVAGPGEGSRAALRELAGSYWYCVYAWWRRVGLDPVQAADATLACANRWLDPEPPSTDDPGAGRMREWLPARLAKLRANGVKREGAAAIAIAPAWAAQRYRDEPPGEPDAIFQRRWALTVLEFSTGTLQAEYAARDEEGLFTELLPFAGFGPDDEERYTTVAARTGRTSGALRKAVFDFRTRQREVLRAYVADTVIDPADVESEMTALLCACEAESGPMAPLPGGAPADPVPLPTAIRRLRPDEVFARPMQSVRMTGAGPGGWTPPTLAEAARLFPQYEVLSLLGRGGMGAVYQARQIELDRLVAIKLLPLEISVDRDFADRFRREARAMAKLDHPNIIGVHDFGTTKEGHLYFVMAFVDGTNLQHLVHRVGLAPEQALAIAGQVCTALAYAHGKGIVHRDIKPANVMIDREGQAKVADFGLARLTETNPESAGVTQTGMVMGTPDYMAPEQMRGLRADHRADIYSVGVMIYEMLCREVPKGAFERPSERIGCDAAIDQLVLKAMQQAPERRYQSTTEMKTDVDRIREAMASRASAPSGEKPARSKKRWIGAAIATVIFGGLFLIFQQRKPAADSIKPAATPVATESGFALPISNEKWVDALAEWRRGKVPASISAEGSRFRAVKRSFHPFWQKPHLVNQAARITVAARPGEAADVGVRVRYNEYDNGARSTYYEAQLIWNQQRVVLRGGSQRPESVLKEWPFPAGVEKAPLHLLELRAVGDELTVRLNDLLLGSFKHAGVPVGSPALNISPKTVLEKFEYLDLGGIAPAMPPAPATTEAAPARPSPPVPPQPSEILTYAGHRYRWIPEELDWTAAGMKAEALGGHLATFTTEEEATWAREHLVAPLQVDERRRYAIGGRAEEDSLDIHWLSGAPVGQLPWISGNPGWRGLKQSVDGKLAAGLYAVRLKDGIPGWIGILPMSAKYAGFIVEWDDGTPDPAPAPRAPIAAATPVPVPATPAPKLRTEVEKWLEQVDGPQQEAFRHQVSEPFETGLAELRKQHLTALDAGIARATAANQLTEAIAWQKERQAFGEIQTVAGADTGLPSGVQMLRAAFRKQAAKLEQDRLAGAKTLHAKYEAVLAQNQTALTQRQRLEDALLLQRKRNEIANAWLTPPGAARTNDLTPAGSAAVPAGPALAFVNSLGIKFAPVPIVAGPSKGQRILFSVWETRVKDYEEFARADALARTPQRIWPAAGFKQAETHPAVQVTWEDAVAFCEWLTKREQKSRLIAANLRYRLPSDLEWSCAAGAAADEDDKATPEQRGVKRRPGVYLWAGGWPPPPRVANLGDQRCGAAGAKKDGVIAGYDDGFAWTAPVGSFPPNALGLYDLSGNVREWCEDVFDGTGTARTFRGGSWFHADPVSLLTGYREPGAPRAPSGLSGFRIVLAPVAESAPAATASAATAVPPAAALEPARPVPPAQSSFALASKERPFVNTLGMSFVPVPVVGGPSAQQRVLFCIWETRVQDYEAFIRESKHEWPAQTFKQTPADPAGNVSWQDAKAFCAWLTARERRAGGLRGTAVYRLPTDHEWSCAIGSRKRENARQTPSEKTGRIEEFPWGPAWPPSVGAGNYSGEECSGVEAGGQQVLKSYRDLFPKTAPVGSFPANLYGLYDLGGNVWEWCEDLGTAPDIAHRVLRGGSYLIAEKERMWWSFRDTRPEHNRGPSGGFRVVLSDAPTSR